MRSQRVPVHLDAPLARSRPSKTSSDVALGRHSVPMSSRLTKKSLRQDLAAVGEHAVGRAVRVGSEHTQTADERGHLRCAQREQLGAVDQQRFYGQTGALAEVVAEPVGRRLERRERTDVGLLLRGVGPPGGERHGDLVASVLRRLLDRRGTTEHDYVGQGHPLAGAVERRLHLAQRGQDAAQPWRIVDLPLVLWGEADACPIGPAALVAVAEGGCRCPGCGDQVGNAQAGGQDRRLEGGNVVGSDQRVRLYVSATRYPVSTGNTSWRVSE